MDAYDYLTSIETQIKAAGFTVADACRKAGMQHSLVCKWRARKYEPRLSSLRRLEAALADLKAARPSDSIESIL